MSKIPDLLLLCFFLVLSRVLSLFLNASFLLSTLLFFGLPALYLTWKIKNKVTIKKAFIFGSLSLIPIFMLDLIALLNQAWFVPSSTFPFRIFNIVPLEDVIWAFLLVYTIILFYEFFLDRGKNLSLIKKPMKGFIFFFVFLAILAIIFLYLNPSLLHISYFYLYSGLIFVFLPTLIFIIRYPHLILKFLKVGVYFFILSLVFELTALALNQWEFPGSEFIGWVNISSLRFPIEELVFWLILFSSAVLSYYEFLYDDKK